MKMKMKIYRKEEFVKLAGINSRQRLNQLINGYTTKGCRIEPRLIEGVDFKKSDIVFFESALKKLKSH
jgi:hypothetical protein